MSVFSVHNFKIYCIYAKLYLETVNKFKNKKHLALTYTKVNTKIIIHVKIL